MTNAEKTKPCQYCGAPMRFIKTVTGNWMPINPEPIDYNSLKRGDVFITEKGEVYKHDPSWLFEEGEKLFVSHFATCPKADLARRQRYNAKKKVKNAATKSS